MSRWVALATVEGDETYIGRKAETRAFLPPAPKQAVVALVERGGAVRSFHVPNVNAVNLQPIIAKHIHMDSRYVTDSSTVSTMLGLPFRGRHQMVNHSARNTCAATCTPTPSRGISLS